MCKFSTFPLIFSGGCILKLRIFPCKIIIFHFIDWKNKILELRDPSYLKDHVLEKILLLPFILWRRWLEGTPVAPSTNSQVWGVCVSGSACARVRDVYRSTCLFYRILVVWNLTLFMFWGRGFWNTFGGWASFCAYMQGCSTIKHCI